MIFVFNYFVQQNDPAVL